MYKVITKTMSMLKNNTVLAVNEKIFVKKKMHKNTPIFGRNSLICRYLLKKLTIDLGHSVSLCPF